MYVVKNWLYLVVIVLILGSCNTSNKPTFNFAADNAVAHLNQYIYSDSVAYLINKSKLKAAVVWNPKPINGNYALVAKVQDSNQYVVVIRGSLIEFSNDGFQNWVMQDFNFFTMQPWKYTDTIKDAYISQGSYNGLQNVLALKDTLTNQTLEQFIANNSKQNTFVISGHSLGGNLAQVFGAYIQKQLPQEQKGHINMVTFGASAAGNKAFVADLEQKFAQGKRYVITNDVAPYFPSIDGVASIAKMLPFANILPNLKQDNLQNNINNTLNGIVDIAKTFNLINDKNNYAQSELHLKKLELKMPKALENNAEIDAFSNAYYYHKIDSYVTCMNSATLK